MERLKSAELQRALNFIRGSYSSHTLDGFVHHAVSDLRHLVASDVTVYGELNPRQRQFRWIMNPEIGFSRFDELYKRLLPQHPYTRHRASGGDGSAVKISDFLSDAEFHRLDLYQLIFNPAGYDREMLLSVSAPRPIEVFVALHRKGRDFTEGDRRMLNLLRPHLMQAYRNAEALSLLHEERSQLHQALDSIPDGVVLLTRTGHVRHISRKADDWLRTYVGRRKGDALPQALTEWVAAQRSMNPEVALSSERAPYMARSEKGSLTVRLLDGDPAILVLEETPTGIDETRLAHLGLSRRETEVLIWIADGKTNDAIATILSISRHTVARHVEAILRKLNVESRTAAAGIAFATLRAGTASTARDGNLREPALTPTSHPEVSPEGHR